MSRFLVTLATVMMLVAPCVAQNCYTDIWGRTWCNNAQPAAAPRQPRQTRPVYWSTPKHQGYQSGSGTSSGSHGNSGSTVTRSTSSHGGYGINRDEYCGYSSYGGARFLHWGPATAADYERFGQEVPAELQSAPAAPADDEEEDADEPATKPKRLLGLKAPARVVAYRPGLRAPDRVAQYRPSAPATTVAMR